MVGMMSTIGGGDSGGSSSVGGGSSSSSGSGGSSGNDGGEGGLDAQDTLLAAQMATNKDSAASKVSFLSAGVGGGARRVLLILKGLPY